MFRYALAAAVMAAASVVYGQAEIEEATPAAVIIPQQHSSTPSSVSNSSGRSDQLSQLFYKMQLLEQQVQELTGLVEEQQYEIRRLKKQRMDDVVSMDRRLSRLEGGTPGTKTSAPMVSDSSSDSSLTRSTTGGNVAVPQPLSSSSDRDVYQAAYQLVKQRRYEQALPALEGYLEQFPMGEYAPNTHYWIGALYVLENNLEKAREWFSLLVNRYPEHNKAESAKFSLAKVYHRLGDVEQAKTLLSDVAAGSSVVASQAQRYLASELTE